MQHWEKFDLESCKMRRNEEMLTLDILFPSRTIVYSSMPELLLRCSSNIYLRESEKRERNHRVGHIIDSEARKHQRRVSQTQRSYSRRTNASRTMKTKASIVPLDVDQVGCRRRSKKSVTWGSVEVHVYRVVLSTNPATHYGPPVELGWEYALADTVEAILVKEDAGEETIIRSPCEIDDGRISVDNYETIRPSDRRRRKLGDMYLDGKSRRELLEEDFTAEEIKEAVREKIALARERASSKRHTTNWMKDKQTRIRKVKRAVRNLQQKQIPKNLYARWWLPI